MVEFTLGQIFRCLPDERIEGGDFEKNDGTGGHSAFTERNFLAEQVELDGCTTARTMYTMFQCVKSLSMIFCVKVPLPDAKGAIRMRGAERLENGRCKVNF